jgi:phage tail-like protein
MTAPDARNDPFLAFRFAISIDNLPVAGFSECNGLQLETEVQDYNEGGLNSNVLKFPGRTKQTNITLKRGIVDRVIWDWYYDLTQGKVAFRSGAIAVLDPAARQLVMVWRFNRAFPTKWVGPDLNATQNNVAIETLELCHQGLMRLP